MKALSTILICLVLSIIAVEAQQGIYYSNLNNINAIIQSDGLLFQDVPNSAAGFEVPSSSDQYAIYSSSLWIAGVDVSDSTVYGATRSFGILGDNFTNGPIADEYNASWNQRYSGRLWVVNKSDINHHRTHFNDVSYLMKQSISDWPAHGDPSNGETYNMAPYIDVNSNGQYDPSNGDYPCIKGDEAVYIIFNSDRDTVVSNNLEVEIHLMVYSFATNDHLNNTLFLEYKLLNKSNRNLADLWIGNFVDFDLGCYDDDFIGCDTVLDMFYGYNGDNVDEDCRHLHGYGVNPGAIGVISLNSELSSFISYQRGSRPNGDPQTVLQHYNLMQGIWRDSNYVVIGGGGYPTDTGATSQRTNFMYPGDPLDTTKWSDRNSGIPPSDRRGVGSIHFANFPAGASIGFDYAVVYARDTNKDNFGNTAELKAAAGFVRNFYDTENFKCPNFAIGVEEKAKKSIDFNIYPNPARDQLNIVCNNEMIRQVEIIDIRGSVALTQLNPSAGPVSLNTSQISRGMYLVRISTEQSISSHRVMIE